MARRATVTDRMLKGSTVQASHDGYRRLKSRASHTRHVEVGSSEVNVRDVVEASSSVTFEVIWHLHPSVVPELDDGIVVCTVGQEHLKVTCDALDLEIVDSVWHPGFGLSEKNHKLVARGQGAVTEVVTHFEFIVR